MVREKIGFHVLAIVVAMVLLFNFIVIESAQSVQASEVTEEEQSIEDLFNTTNVVADDDGYTLTAEGDLSMEDDPENGIEAGNYHISLHAEVSLSDNYFYFEVVLTTPDGEEIVQSGVGNVMSTEAYEHYNTMLEEEKDDIKSLAAVDETEVSEEEYITQGGIGVDDLAKILDVAILVMSLVATIASLAVVTWQAMQISGGLVRNILKKVAYNALNNFLQTYTLKRFLGDAMFQLAGFVAQIICIASNISIGKAIAMVIDKIDGNENGRCFA